MKKYLYRNKKTGIKIQSDKLLDNKDLELVMTVRGGLEKINILQK